MDIQPLFEVTPPSNRTRWDKFAWRNTMLIMEMYGRKILLSSDNLEELGKIKKVVKKMEAEHDVKVYDKEDHVVVFVTNVKMWAIEVLMDIKTLFCES